MARMHAYVSICPHVDQRKRKITPQTLLPFPWDGQKPAEKSPAMTAEEQRKRMKELAERLGDKMINE